MMCPRRTLALQFLAVSYGLAGVCLPGCQQHAQKASTQDLAARIQSAGDDERREIIRVLSNRGEAALPEILQAFQSTDQPATQMVLADAVAHMKRSEQRQEALKKMQELAKDSNVRRTIGAYVMDPR